MPQILLSLLSILSWQLQTAQPVDWNKSDGWTLFACYSQGAEPKPAGSLHQYDSLKLDMDTMRSYLAGAVPIPPERSAGARWMGAYWASCNIGGIPKIVEISTYGGFFVDQETGIYYELPRPLRQAWLGYFREQFKGLRLKQTNNGPGGG